MKYLKYASLLLAISGCSRESHDSTVKESPRSAASREISFDMNDAAYLWSNPTDATSYNQLIKVSDLTTSGSRGPILSQQDFDAIDAIGGIPVPEWYNYYRVVGMRLDPCQRPQTPGETQNYLLDNECVFEFRLVLQAKGMDNYFEDRALHVIYQLDKSMALPMVRELLDLRDRTGISTRGIPLGVHPGLKDLSGQFAAGLKAFVLKYADHSKLRDVTSVENSQSVWVFAKASMVNGNLVPQVIPGVVRQTTTGAKNVFLIDNQSNGRNGFKATTLPSQVTPEQDWLTPGLTRDAKFTEKGRSATLLFFNPLLRTPGKGDCLSCHFSDNAISQDPTILQDQNEPNRYRLPASDVGKITNEYKGADAGPNIVNFRNFGYFENDATYSIGTNNDVARVVSIIRHQMLGL